jgi:hypothetical protein
MKTEELWETEISWWIEGGLPPDIARGLTIMRWAYYGDLRPLSETIKAGPPFDPALLGFLVEMIDSGRLQVKQPRRGSPKRPQAFARNLLAAIAYEEKDGSESSEEAFERIASILGISPQSVRQAVTRKRKHSTK